MNFQTILIPKGILTKKFGLGKHSYLKYALRRHEIVIGNSFKSPRIMLCSFFTAVHGTFRRSLKINIANSRKNSSIPAVRKTR